MAVIATAGHIDHGKSSLVRALTGVDPDRLPEERRRGITIDLGFAAFTYEGTAIEFVDVPGHERFIRTMAAGIHAATGCLFVVSAFEGWKPQSSEHLAVLSLMGTKRGVVALTMADRVSEVEAIDAAAALQNRLSGSFLEASNVIMCSARTGQGIEALRNELVGLATSTPVLAPPDHGRCRLWIDRSFSARGSGTVVTGTLTGGAIRRGQTVDLMPASRHCRVRALQIQGRGHDVAEPGRRVAVNLADTPLSYATRGSVLIDRGAWLLTQECDASVAVIASSPHALTNRGAHLVHIGTGEWAAQIRIIGGQKLAVGEAGFLRLKLPMPLPIGLGDRMLLRDASTRRVVAGGTIVDVDPTTSIRSARPPLTETELVAQRGWIDVDLLFRMTGRRQSPTVGRWLVDEVALDEAIRRIATQVAAAAPQPLEFATFTEQEQAVLRAGMVPEVDTVAGRVGARGLDSPVAHAWLAEVESHPFSPPPPHGLSQADLRALVYSQRLVRCGRLYFARSAVAAAARVAAELAAANPAPPGFAVSDFRDALRTSRKNALALLNLLDSRGVTIRVGAGRLLRNAQWPEGPPPDESQVD